MKYWTNMLANYIDVIYFHNNCRQPFQKKNVKKIGASRYL